MPIARHVRKLEAYVYGEQPKDKRVVKLNTNENAYPPSPKISKTLAAFDLDKLRRYCNAECADLRKALAELNCTTPDRIFVGNGSDEILSLAARAFVENDEQIGSFDPSYSLYKTLAAIRDVKWTGLDVKTAPLDSARLPPKTSLFLLTNPNAPTGTFRTCEEVERFARKFKGVVIVDEAYADFSRGNCMSLATEENNRNVIVMRTFSKSFSLAGLRVGYCVGPKDLIAALFKIKDSYNVDAIAQAVALAAVKDIGWMRENVRKIVATRASFSAALEKRGWDVIPSEANFVFVRPPRGNAAELFAALREQKIFVRYFKGPLTGDRLRITIGTPAQMKKLLAALDALERKNR